uniref:ZP domain-containing protein n=1 Tax=Tetraodon nigroviridis TaxID=99883 RepID=H3CA36_TETNG
VMFQQGEQKHSPMTLSQAAKQGYAFFLTSGRLVFRTPYGQPHSLNTEVNGVPVEVVYVTMYSRQSWVVLMIDLVAACSMDEGSPDGDHMVWRTLDPLYPSLSIVDVSVGLNGQLLEQPAAEKRGYTVQKHDSRLQISVPFDADGRYRKSFVNGSLFDFYVFHVYSEQILLSQDQVETRLRLHRTMTAVVQRPLLTENRTILEEEVFTAYLGKLPEDVVLAAVTLNGEEYTLPLANTSSHTITKVTYADNTQGYTLRVPFEHPVVGKKLVEDEALLQHILNIQYTLVILPENTTYYHPAAITAVVPQVPPPDIDASCLDSGIRFRLKHQPFSYLWQITVGSAVLTSDLATQRGYTVSNDSQSLQFYVPLFTPGYEYTNVTLERFSGTFEISVRRPEASGGLRSFTETCPFSPPEYIFCSEDGVLTVMVDSSTVVKGVENPATAHLLDKSCKPTVSEGTRVQFSFLLNSCGTTAKVDGDILTYENEI